MVVKNQGEVNENVASESCEDHLERKYVAVTLKMSKSRSGTKKQSSEKISQKEPGKSVCARSVMKCSK